MDLSSTITCLSTLHVGPKSFIEPWPLYKVSNQLGVLPKTHQLKKANRVNQLSGRSATVDLEALWLVASHPRGGTIFRSGYRSGREVLLRVAIGLYAERAVNNQKHLLTLRNGNDPLSYQIPSLPPETPWVECKRVLTRLPASPIADGSRWKSRTEQQR